MELGALAFVALVGLVGVAERELVGELDWLAAMVGELEAVEEPATDAVWVADGACVAVPEVEAPGLRCCDGVDVTVGDGESVNACEDDCDTVGACEAVVVPDVVAEGVCDALGDGSVKEIEPITAAGEHETQGKSSISARHEHAICAFALWE